MKALVRITHSGGETMEVPMENYSDEIVVAYGKGGVLLYDTPTHCWYLPPYLIQRIDAFITPDPPPIPPPPQPEPTPEPPAKPAAKGKRNG